MKKGGVLISLIFVLFSLLSYPGFALNTIPLGFSADDKHLLIWCYTFYALPIKKDPQDGIYLATRDGQVQKIIALKSAECWGKEKGDILYYEPIKTGQRMGIDIYCQKIGWYNVLTSQDKTILLHSCRNPLEISKNQSTIFINHYLATQDLILCSLDGSAWKEDGSKEDYQSFATLPASGGQLRTLWKITSPHSFKNARPVSDNAELKYMRESVPDSGQWCLVAVKNPKLIDQDKTAPGVYKINLLTGQREKIFDFVPTFAEVRPDGQKILVVDEIITKGQLKVYDLASKQWEVLVDTLVDNPRWVGKSIAYFAQREKDIYDFCLINEDKKVQKLIEIVDRGAYCFSKDGDLVALQRLWAGPLLYNLRTKERVYVKIP